MIWWFIAAGFTVIFLFAGAFDDGLPGATFGLFAGGLLAGFAATMLNLFCMNIGYRTTHVESFVTGIVNLRDGSETEGHGSLFTFVMETYPRFTYYVQNADGSFSPEYVDDDVDHHVRIFEDGQGSPRLDCMTERLAKDHNSDWSIFGASVDTSSCGDYVFHVPPGTVSRQFGVGGPSGSGGSTNG